MSKCYLCKHPTRVLLVCKSRNILRCDNCKLTYTTDDAPDDGHVREDSPKFVEEYLKELPLYKDYFDSIIRTIRTYIPEPKSLLDVGCSVGVFLQTAADQHWKAEGVEMSPWAADQARSHGFKVHLGKIEDLKLRPGSFDVITLFQVIEHIEQPLKLIEKLHSLLRKGGILVITTPNEESLMAKIQGKGWFGYTNIEHVFFFNPKSLYIMQQYAGFHEVNIRTESGRTLSMPWVLTRLFDYYYTQPSLLTSLANKSRPMWPYMGWVRGSEPHVNLVSVAVKP